MATIRGLLSEAYGTIFGTRVKYTEWLNNYLVIIFL